MGRLMKKNNFNLDIFFKELSNNVSSDNADIDDTIFCSSNVFDDCLHPTFPPRRNFMCSHNSHKIRFELTL